MRQVMQMEAVTCWCVFMGFKTAAIDLDLINKLMCAPHRGTPRPSTREYLQGEAQINSMTSDLTMTVV